MTDWLSDLIDGWLPDDSYAPSGGAVAWLQSKHEVAHRIRPAFIAEIGVRAGYSAFAMLSACPDARFLGIDAGDARYGDGRRFRRHAAGLLRRFPNVDLRHEDSHTIERLPEGIDLLHVDGDHSYHGCLADLDLALRSGVKWMLVDDVDYLTDVDRAVRKWIARHGLATEHIRDGHRGSALIHLEKT